MKTAGPVRSLLIMMSAVLPLLAGCQSQQQVDRAGVHPEGGSGGGSGVGPGVEPAVAEGYTLLHNLCRKQSRAGQAFVVVSAHEQTQQVVKGIAAASSDLAQRIKQHAAQSTPPIPLDRDGLPAVEIRARDTSESRTTRAILFGKNSERTLVLAQVEATHYAASLAEGLAGREPEQAMAEALRRFAEQMRQYHSDLVELVRIVPTAAQATEP